MASNAGNKVKACLLITQKISAEYAEYSTVHGVSYISENGRSWFEKVWWLVVLSLSVLFCGKMIFDASQISPIIISFTDKPTPIWQVPFPAVTICPNSITNWSLAKILYFGEDYFHNLSENEKLQTLAKSAFCYYDWMDMLKNYSNCNGCLDTMRKMLLPLEEYFVECKFKNEIFKCSKALEEVVLDNTICYTFNGFKVYRQNDAVDEMTDSEWSIEGGYGPTASASAYPRRVFSVGPRYGLSLLLRSDNRYFDPQCRRPYESFRVEYQMPYSRPQLRNNFVLVTMERSLNLIIKPKIIVTSDEVRDYSVQERNCYFSYERRLTYFRKYTQLNCEIECLVKELLAFCGCLPIFIENHTSFNTCGPVHSKCLALTDRRIKYENYRSCICLPLCSSISFDAELQVSKLHNDDYASNASVQYTRLNIYFRENQLMAIKRSELYGQTDFLANCGGLFGLFLGVSVLSFLEFVYFCTVRLWSFVTVQSARNTISNDGLKNLENSQQGISKTNQFLQIFKKLIADYCSKTTLQGIRYVGEHDLSKAERIWWAGIVGVSAYCCGSLISDVLARYDQAPVIISYSNEETTISEIPFPAVTICPQIFAKNLNKGYDYFNIQGNTLYAREKSFQSMVTALAQVCEPSIFGDVDPEYRTNCENCSKTLKNLLGDTNKFFWNCEHIRENLKCSELLKSIATDDGVCFVYNALQPYRVSTINSELDITDNWTLDGGYRNNTGNNDVHPLAGSKTRLSVKYLVHKFLNDYVCKGPIQGIKVYLHLPIEPPQISKHFYMMPYQHLTEMSINPQMTVSAPELRGVPVVKRQCYFSDERYLRFFRYYTQNNCEIECLANLTISRCGCLMFYMPKQEGVKFCGIGEVMCQHVTAKLSVEQNINRDDSIAGCHCLPSCTSITYDTQVNHVFRSSEYIDKIFFEGFSKQFSQADIEILFQKNQFVALKRSQLFDETEILANCGGLLGLFLGFSVISILELFYFCCIRLCCTIKMQFSE